MLSRLFQQKHAIVYSNFDIDISVKLNISQWDLIENLVSILKIFEDAIFVISTATVTASKVISIVNNIKKPFQTQTSVVDINQIYVNIVNIIHKRFKYLEIKPNYCLATLLDRRQKSSVFLNEKDGTAIEPITYTGFFWGGILTS